MTRSLPEYYTSLEPFRDLLLSGHGLLTYHHVGPRPAGARIKGLYVSPKLFQEQLAELQQAGFSAPDYNRVLEQAPAETDLPHTSGEGSNGRHARGRQVFLTFDDGFVDTFENALPVLRQTGFRAIQFLVAGLLGKISEWQVPCGDVAGQLMDCGQIKDWLAAGNEIGSHTSSHPRLTRLAPAQAREEIEASKKMLEDTFGRPIQHFCYPYGDFNECVMDLVKKAGYESACTTEFGVNNRVLNPFALKRIMARYKSWSLRALFSHN